MRQCCHYQRPPASLRRLLVLAPVEQNRAYHCLEDPAHCAQRYFTPRPKTVLQAREYRKDKIDPTSDLFGALSVCKEHGVDVYFCSAIKVLLPQTSVSDFAGTETLYGGYEPKACPIPQVIALKTRGRMPIIIEDFLLSNGKRFLFQNFQRLVDAAFFSEFNKKLIQA